LTPFHPLGTRILPQCLDFVILDAEWASRGRAKPTAATSTIGGSDLAGYSFTRLCPRDFGAVSGAMDIPTDLPGILSEFGLPAGAIALAYGLVKGADALEADASEEALKSISRLLRKGPPTAFGPLGAAVVPFVFDKIFGPTPVSGKFVKSYILASLLFLIILISIKRSDWTAIYLNIKLDRRLFFASIPSVLLIDWLSLTKASFVLKAMSNRQGIMWLVTFLIIDVTLISIIFSWSCLPSQQSVLLLVHFLLSILIDWGAGSNSCSRSLIRSLNSAHFLVI
jgi:hypothetical protein